MNHAKETILLKQYHSDDIAIRMSDSFRHATSTNVFNNFGGSASLRRKLFRHCGETQPTSTRFYRDCRRG